MIINDVGEGSSADGGAEQMGVSGVVMGAAWDRGASLVCTTAEVEGHLIRPCRRTRRRKILRTDGHTLNPPRKCRRGRRRCFQR